MSLHRIPEDIVSSAEVGDIEDGEACNVCSLVFEEDYRVPLCHDGVHVWCVNCATDAFTEAVERDCSLIPLHCDGRKHPVSVDALRHLLPQEIVKRYKSKLEEQSSVLRLYCSSRACGNFLPKRTHHHFYYSSWAECRSCKTITCVGCGDEWRNKDHECDPARNRVELPPYSSDMRIKQCPHCRRAIELSAACNHMTCDCGFEFCFVCLLWFNDYHDCPHYRDPQYDENHRDWRGLHVRTGRDADGYNRVGYRAEDDSVRQPRVLRPPENNIMGPANAAALHGGNQPVHQQVEINGNGGLINDQLNGEVVVGAENNGWNAENQVAHVPVIGHWNLENGLPGLMTATGEDLANADQLAPETRWPRLPRQPRFPEPTGPPAVPIATIEQAQCDHTWRYRGGTNRCFGCNWLTDIFHYYCTKCQIITCRECTSNMNEILYFKFGEAATNFSIEQMELIVTVEARRDAGERYLRKFPLERSNELYHIDTMIAPCQEKYEMSNAFADADDFGIQALFAPFTEEYEIERLFHVTISVPGGNSKYTVFVEVPIGSPTMFSLMGMDEEQFSYWAGVLLGCGPVVKGDANW